MHLLEQSWLVLLFDASIKSILLAVGAALALFVLRVSNANVRHRVWAAVLLGMISLPLLVPVTPTVPIPSWLVPEFPAVSANEPSTRDATDVQGQTPSASDWEGGGGEAWMNIESFAGANNVELPSEWSQQGDSTSMAPAPTEDARTSSHSTPAPPPASQHLAGAPTTSWFVEHGRRMLLATYVFVAIGFFARVFVGIWGTYRILARCRQCQTPASAMNGARSLGAIDLVESDDLCVPLTVGWFRPKILLPPDWRQWSRTKLDAVLAHESAHVRRGDYVVTLIAEFNRAVYWFHPLSWLLRRWLSELAEQNCDDAVIASTGERTQYARHLLEVASSLHGKQGRAAWSAVAMARKPTVETRIDAILDAKRPLARRLGMASILLLVATAVPAVLFAAALRPGYVVDGEDNNDAAAIESREDAEETGGLAEVRNSPVVLTAARPQVSYVNTQTLAALYPDHQRVNGTLVNEGGQPVSGTVHVVVKRSGNQTRPGSEEVIKQVRTDADGSFDFPVDLPRRDDAIDRGVWDAKVVQIVATAEGYGPAVSDAIGIRKGEPITLRLARDDVPIQGQILDLEGQPVVGAQVRVALMDPSRDVDKFIDTLRKQAQKEKPNRMMASFVAEEHFLDSKIPAGANERIVANQLMHSRFTPETATTDESGRFRLTGLGRDRAVALVLTGPGIVKSWISLISREMQPINASIFIGSRTRVTYGAKFTYSAEPSQPIEGTVTDVDTGEPIPDVTIETDHYDAGHVSSVTDENGRYRLDGLPKKQRHALRITPPSDVAYFPRRHFEVTEVAEGLEPTRVNLQLRKTTWIQGRVVDMRTREPVSARVVYSPHITNRYAEQHATFVKGRFSDLFGEGAGVATDPDGYFRIRAIPGDGMLFVRADELVYCTGSGSKTLSEKWFGFEQQRMTNTYSPAFPESVHRLQVVNVPEAGNKETLTLPLDPGATLDLRFVDPTGAPLEGVRIRGRVSKAFAFGLDPPIETDRVSIHGISPNNPRSVFFYHEQRNLGAFLVANQQNSEARTIQLQQCATLRGRLVGSDGKPLVNLPIGLNPVDMGNREVKFVIAKTDKDGRFSAARVIPATRFDLYPMAFRAAEKIGETIELTPGQTLDVGTIRSAAETPAQLQGFVGFADGAGEDENERLEGAQKATEGVEEAKDGERARSAATQTSAELPRIAGTVSVANTNPGTPLSFAGQVMLPNGKPASDISIYHVRWFRSPWRELPTKSVAKTDSQGRFRFERSLKSLTTGSDSGSIVATRDGYAFAVVPAIELERTGQLIALMKQNELRGGESKVSLRTEPLRLLPDDRVVRGRLVDSEGNGIAGANVSVTEVLSSRDGTSRAWDQIIGSGKADMNLVRTAMPIAVRGPEVSAVFGRKTTAGDGTFEIDGLGDHRVARIVISRPDTESASMYVRTNGGQTIDIPYHLAEPIRKERFYGSEFTYVATKSRPVVGIVTDKATGQPIAGAVVTSSRSWMQTPESRGKLTVTGNDDVYAVSDDRGHFRLDGLPTAPWNALHVQLPNSQYLPESSHVSTVESGVLPIEKNLTLEKGIVVEGRVANVETGKGVQGTVEFMAATNKVGRAAPMMFGPSRQVASRFDGSFRLLVPKADGHVCFTAFARHKYKLKPRPAIPDAVESTPEAGSLVGFRAFADEFHALQRVRSDQSDAKLVVDWKLNPAPHFIGHAVDAQGTVVTDLFYVGAGDDFPRWQPTRSGELTIYGLKGSRRVAVVSRERQLAGLRTLGEAEEGFGIQMMPWATVRGRIVDEDGDPIAAAQIRSGGQLGPVTASPGNAMQSSDHAFPVPLPPADELGNRTGILTNEEGRFEIKGLVPDHAYTLTGSFYGDPIQPISNDIAKQLILQPAEQRDLGTIVLKNKDETPAVTGTLQVSTK